MRVVFIARHFPPDSAPEGPRLEIVARHLAKTGNQVMVITAMPDRQNVKDIHLKKLLTEQGVAVLRLRLLRELGGTQLVRAANSVIFTLCAFVITLIIAKPDVLITVTNPPILCGALGYILSILTGARHIYWCQDIWPEVAKAGRRIRIKWLLNCMASVERLSRRNATLVTLSSDMVASLQHTLPRRLQIHIINNFFTDDEDVVYANPAHKSNGRFTVLFAGNFGQYQDLPCVIRAARRLREISDIQFILIGGGTARPRLLDEAGDLLGINLHVEQSCSRAKAFDLMTKSDVGLITLRHGIIRFAYPSKTISYLRAGCRVIAMVDSGCELDRLIRSERLGSVCPPGDDFSLANAILNQYQTHDNTDGERKRIAAFAQSQFAKEPALRKFDAIMKAFASGSIA